MRRERKREEESWGDGMNQGGPAVRSKARRERKPRGQGESWEEMDRKCDPRDGAQGQWLGRKRLGLAGPGDC